MNEDDRELVAYLAARQKEAFNDAPLGTWRQRWIPGACAHRNVRCVHGDEIAHRQGRRACLDCGRTLPGDLPEMCFFLGRPHAPQTGPEATGTQSPTARS